MQTEMVAIFIPITLIIVTGLVLYYFLTNKSKERMALIEKSTSHEDLKLLFSKKQSSEPSVARMAKWGILLISIGAAILVGLLLQPYADEAILFGLLFLFPGIGLLVYYSIFKTMAQPTNPED